MKVAIRLGRGAEAGSDPTTPPDATPSGAGAAARPPPAVGRDGYQPRQSRRVTVAIEGDDDVWVERSYVGMTGRRIPYYCSTRTGRWQLFEPPTGAAVVLHECHYRSGGVAADLPENVLETIHQRHSRQDILAMLRTNPRQPAARAAKRWAWGIKWPGLTTKCHK